MPNNFISEQTSGLQNIPTPAENNINEEGDDSYKNFFDYNTTKIKIDALISGFKSRVDEVAKNRSLRKVELDRKALVKSGKIKSDEIYVPSRVIDTNIRRELPPFINYLKQSKRLAVFKSLTDPNKNVELLEDEFTRLMQYPEWENPFFKLTDGTQTHGFDWVEVVLDLDKPGHIAIEHIGNDKLYFNLAGTQNHQVSEILLREYSFNTEQLKTMVRNFDWNKEQIDTLISKSKGKTEENFYTFFKKFCKYEGVVYVAWYSKDLADWAKPPEPLFLGRRQKLEQPEITEPTYDPVTGLPIENQQSTNDGWENIEETEYPIFFLPYTETEEPNINDHVGRVFLDKHKQEAMTTNITSFINGCVRASRIYASPTKNDESSSNQINNKLKTISLEDGTIIPTSVSFWNLPSPSPQQLQLAQYLETSNAAEAGQQSHVLMGRGDRKTKFEVQTAREETAMLSSVQVTLYSTFLRKLFTFCWKIIQSRAQQGVIDFLIGQQQAQIREELLNDTYDIRAAGDVDVIKRAELLQRLKEFWPVVQGTAIATKFLAKMLKIAFPEDGSQLAQELLASERTKQVLASLVEILKSSITPAELVGIDKQKIDTLNQVIAEAALIVNPKASEQEVMEHLIPDPNTQTPENVAALPL